MTRYRPVTVATGRHPFELAFLLSCVIVGPLLIAADSRPRSVTEAMPAWVQICWEFGIAAAGIIGLAGVFRPGKLSAGLAVELFAMAIAGTALSMYAIALVAVNGWGALASGSFVAAFALGSWGRLIQIWRDLTRAGRAVAAGDVVDVTLLAERKD